MVKTRHGLEMPDTIYVSQDGEKVKATALKPAAAGLGYIYQTPSGRRIYKNVNRYKEPTVLERSDKIIADRYGTSHDTIKSVRKFLDPVSGRTWKETKTIDQPKVSKWDRHAISRNQRSKPKRSLKDIVKPPGPTPTPRPSPPPRQNKPKPKPKPLESRLIEARRQARVNSRRSRNQRTLPKDLGKFEPFLPIPRSSIRISRGPKPRDVLKKYFGVG